MKYKLLAAVAFAAPIALAQPAVAKPGDPVMVNDDLTIDPIIAGRLRYETVDQDNAPGNADAVTMRLRAGAEVKLRNLSLLAEAEGTLAIIDDYNDTVPGNGIEPYPVVADPDNVELNRLQIGYTAANGSSVTIGRQRIILDNARFVGNVGWRQNEQTFDAVRGIANVGPVALDATYAISQRTVFGADSPNEHFDGDLILLNGGVKTGIADLKAFAYLVDYDRRVAFSSQTYGALAKASIPIARFKLDAMASYARQSDYKASPIDYSADYIAAELGASAFGFRLKAGYEELGSDDGIAAFQTPLATLHAFNGWADVFLTTPATGLRDFYMGIGKGFAGVKILSALNAAVTYHKFESDFGDLDYGEEWDASVGFRIRNLGVLIKYARYDAEDFAVDTEKLWLQIEFAY